MRFIKISILLILFFSCKTQKAQKINSPPLNPIYGLASPFQLSDKKSTIYLQDYFLSPNAIDSISSSKNLIASLSQDKQKLGILIRKENQQPVLEELKCWVDGKAYSLILKKSRKVEHTFSFNPQDTQYKTVKVAGNFNDWNPNNTIMKWRGDAWEATVKMNPGNYQYQIVANDQWILDPANPDSIDNNIGGFNSPLIVSGGNPSLAPKLFSKSYKEKSITLGIQNKIQKVVALWQNQALPIKKTDTELIIDIPEEAKNLPRSFIRVFAYNTNGAANDILIPLEKGKIIESPTQLTRQDKHTNILYFMMVDRFNNGNAANDKKVDNPDIEESVNYHGGDLAGITQKINDGYFQNLNINTLWLSPITQNHTKINPHFGTSTELKELVALAHRNNINILLEFDTFLPSLDLSKPEVIETVTDSTIYWIQEYDLDGFRHDATKHIPKSFWRRLTQKLKTEIMRPQQKDLYQIGETFGSRELIGSYVNTGQLDGQFDFNLYFDARAVFALDSEDFNRLNQSLTESFSYYGHHSLMGNISSNHDMPRFLAYAGEDLQFNEDPKAAGWSREITVKNPIGYKKLSALTAFIMTIPGIPVLYYGDEMGMVGADDPDNRRPMRFEGWNKGEQTVYDNAQKLTALRRNHLALIYGDFQVLNVQKETYAYLRSYFGDNVIVVFNKSAKKQKMLINLPTHLKGKAFKHHFNGAVEVSGSKLGVQLPPYSFEVLTVL